VPSSLNSVTITGGKEIFKNAFLHCENLTDITITEGVIQKGPVFAYCYNLKQVKLGEGSTCIYESTFCVDDLSKITIPATVQLIERNAFISSKLTAVEFVNYVGWQVEIPTKEGKKPKIKKIKEKLLMDEVKSAELLTEYSSAKWVNTLDLTKMKKF
jgi:hypothetical protein